MNRFFHLLMALVALLAGAQIVRAQTPADHKRAVVDGSVESANGQVRVILTNTDGARSFRGEARVNLGASDRQSEVARFEFTLAPQESRIFPLDPRSATGDHYTLSVYERAGALIFLRTAAVQRGMEAAPTVVKPLAGPIPAPATTATTGAKGLTVKARLAAGPPVQSRRVEVITPTVEVITPTVEIIAPAAAQPNQPQSGEATASTPNQSSEPQIAVIKKPSAKLARRRHSGAVKPAAVEQPKLPQAAEVEAPVSDEPGSIVLVFDIVAPTPIINASLNVRANDFKERQTITVQGSAAAEFKLPDDFNEPKIAYTFTDASGKTLIAGELDFEALRMEDSVRIGEVKIDQESYAPGQSAQIVMTLEGNSAYGYFLQVTARDENGAILLDDSRRGVYNKGKSIQEFRVEIPAEAKGVIAVEFKAFGNLTRKLFDSGSRDLIIQ
jgi:hypothetical protein